MSDYKIHESTLKDIANVIRKKDGTTALIDPADFDDRINLMGMLEEKTVSGAIASFSDGADDVPLKSLVCNVDANLSGVSSVGVVHTGKNLCQNNLSNETVSGVTITVNADGTITLDGTATARITRNLCTNFELKAGTYTLSCGTSE